MNGIKIDGTQNSISATKIEAKKSEFQKYFPGLDQKKINGSVSTSVIRSGRNVAAEAARNPEKKKLLEAAHEFQAIFLNMMLKSMRKNLNPKQDMLFGGHSQEIFEDMLYDEYAKLLSYHGHMNLAEQIYLSLDRSDVVRPGTIKKGKDAGTGPAQNQIGGINESLRQARAQKDYRSNLNIPMGSPSEFSR